MLGVGCACVLGGGQGRGERGWEPRVYVRRLEEVQWREGGEIQGSGKPRGTPGRNKAGGRGLRKEGEIGKNQSKGRGGRNARSH